MSSRIDPRTRRATKPGGSNSSGGMVTFLVLMTPAALFALPTTLLAVVGLIPTAVAYLVDRDPDKLAPITVGALNICGILPFVMGMWKHGHTMSESLRLLGDPFTWLVIYGAAALGWGFYFLVPPMIANFEIMRAESRIMALHEAKRELVVEWGPEVAFDDEELARKNKPPESKS
ncbi:MAG: hypothetical protein WCF85_06300 [Rhodospirillaceae bacterium]